MTRDEILASVGPGWRALLEREVLVKIPIEEIVRVKETFGQLDIRIGPPKIGEPGSIHRERARYLEAVYDVSGSICEMCGAPGHSRRLRRIKTLCDVCAVVMLTADRS